MGGVRFAPVPGAAGGAAVAAIRGAALEVLGGIGLRRVDRSRSRSHRAGRHREHATDLISVFDDVSQTLDTMSFFDAETLEPRSPVIEKEGTWQTMAAVAPGGQWVVADNLFPASVQVNELGSGRLLADLPIETPLFGGAGFAIPPSGELVLVTSLLDGNSFIIDASTWKRRESPIPPGQAAVAAFSPTAGGWRRSVPAATSR